MIRYLNLTVDEICEKIDTPLYRRLTRDILTLFLSHGLTYKVREGDAIYRIYCYIKKSREALILNIRKYRVEMFDIQLRIVNRDTLRHLEDYSENFCRQLLDGKNCRASACSNCGNAYVFTYQEKEYCKCHMLCDNFQLYTIGEEDYASLLAVLREEIAFDMPRRKRNPPAAP